MLRFKQCGCWVDWGEEISSELARGGSSYRCSPAAGTAAGVCKVMHQVDGQGSLRKGVPVLGAQSREFTTCPGKRSPLQTSRFTSAVNVRFDNSSANRGLLPAASLSLRLLEMSDAHWNRAALQQWYKQCALAAVE